LDHSFLSCAADKQTRHTDRIRQTQMNASLLQLSSAGVIKCIKIKHETTNRVTECVSQHDDVDNAYEQLHSS